MIDVDFLDKEGKMETRSKDALDSFEGLTFFRRDPMNLSILQQLPTHIYFYERYLTHASSKTRPSSNYLSNEGYIVLLDFGELKMCE